jgi:hypothetical protein
MKALFLHILACAAIAAAALATALVTVTSRPDTSAIIPATREGLLPSPEQIAIDMVPLREQLTVITDRPLFSQSRRPFKPVPLAPPSQVPVPLKVQPFATEMPPIQNLVLKGVMLNDENARALIASEANPSGAWIRKGEMIDGWRLIGVGANTVELEQMGRKAALKLYAHESMNELNPPAQPYIEQKNIH